MAKKSRELAVPGKGGALVGYAAQMAQYAQDAADNEQISAGAFIRTRGGILSVGDEPVKGNELDVLIIDYVFENTYYANRFNADEVEAPVCFAFDRKEDDMAPHADSTDKQNETCEGCPQNQFGSADTGRGKACANRRRLALLHAGDLSVENILNGELMYLKTPPTSGAGWAMFVKGLNNTYKLPPFGVVTKITVVPDKKKQFKVVFTAVEPLSEELMGAVLERRQMMADSIMFPYKQREEEPAAPARGGARKFARPATPAAKPARSAARAR